MADPSPVMRSQAGRRCQAWQRDGRVRYSASLSLPDSALHMLHDALHATFDNLQQHDLTHSVAWEAQRRQQGPSRYGSRRPTAATLHCTMTELLGSAAESNFERFPYSPTT
jgi:hypothetical protein